VRTVKYRDYNGGSKNHAAMKLPRYYPFRLIAPFTLAVALCCANAWAEKADKNKPMFAEADALRYDDLKQTGVYTGNVVITKGTMILRGAKVDVRKDAEGFQFGNAIETGGKRAFFRQKRDAPDEWIEGEAETIYYDGKADTVTFTKNAVLRRYKGTVVNDEASGSQIVYDNVTDVFNVVGGAANASASNPTGRVRVMITPQDPSSALRPAAPPATLRPSTTVGGDRK
jgi:lipopolysaccharide export system protein LptA